MQGADGALRPAPVRASWRPPARTLLAAFASAALFTLSFPLSEDFVAGWPLTFAWPALLAVTAVRAPSWRAAASALFPAFFVAFLVHQWWMREVTELGMPILVAYLAAWMTLFGLLVRVIAGPRPPATNRGSQPIQRNVQLPIAFVLPPVLVAVEFLRGDLVCTGYAWFFAAHPLVEFNPVAQLAALGGGWLVSGFAGFIAGAAADLVVARKGARIAIPLGASLVAFAVVWFGMHAAVRGAIEPSAKAENEPPAARILLVQTNLPMSNKLAWSPDAQAEDFLNFAALTIRGARASTDAIDLAVWPETMLPGLGLEPDALELLESRRLYPGRRYEEALRDLSQRIAAPLVVGSPSYLGLRVERNRFEWSAHHNSAYLVDTNGARGRTDKIFLTPFGETMPIISRSDWLEARLLALGADGMTFDLEPAAAPGRFLVEGNRAPIRVGVPICFEITAPWASRRIAFDQTERAADVLLNISNDGWFAGSDAGRRQHLQVAQLRAIELRTPVLRAANTGISAWIDATGVVRSRLPARSDGTLVAQVAPQHGAPISVYVGDGVAWAALVLVLALVAALPAFRIAAVRTRSGSRV
jgi:apolipoprotein N-acyltransferase